MIPRDYQIDLSEDVYNILVEFSMAYIAMEERTGKTLISLLAAERLSPKNILVVTKKASLDSWHDVVAQYKLAVPTVIINYHKAKLIQGRYDVVILDEAHNYISSYPKPSGIWKNLKALLKDSKIIYLSATPSAQGYQQLYHQFALSSFSPWRKYKNFYSWFEEYGIPKTIYIHSRRIIQYNNTHKMKVLRSISHLFVTKTRKALGFKYEPIDDLCFISLDATTKKLYNSLLKTRLVKTKSGDVVASTIMAMKAYLHMIEGGTVHCLNESNDIIKVMLSNTEKIDYIKTNFGDTKDIAIYYYYQSEKIKLGHHFKNALLLQSSSYAEGIELSHIKYIIIYSQDFSTSKYIQRRARQASLARSSSIRVKYLIVKGGVSEQVYTTVAVNKKNYTDSLFGEKLL